MRPVASKLCSMQYGLELHKCCVAYLACANAAIVELQLQGQISIVNDSEMRSRFTKFRL